MVKVMIKRVPQKINQSMQHKVMKSWSSTMIESHSPNTNIKIVSGKEASRTGK